MIAFYNHMPLAEYVHEFGNYRINPLALCLSDSSLQDHIALGLREQ
jgi:hypothetical protein